MFCDLKKLSSFSKLIAEVFILNLIHTCVPKCAYSQYAGVGFQFPIHQKELPHISLLRNGMNL